MVCRKGRSALADLTSLEKKPGFTFKTPSLLEQALVHSSYINENPGFAVGHNERLEFLGDAILGFVIAEKLYKDFPEFSEGDMTRLRALLVRRDTLARVAKEIGLGEYLYLGKGEEASGGRHKPANLAGAMEAVIAVVFLDKGLAATREFVLRWFAEELGKSVKRGTVADYKSRLQEFLQAHQKLAPSYRLAEAMGPDHDKSFTVEVMAGDTVLGTGSGKSKKAAEMEAARLALKRLSNDFTQ